MKITRCKLTRNPQHKLLQYFILEVTARSAADLMSIQANSAALFYHKIRLVIADYLAMQEAEMFNGSEAALAVNGFVALPLFDRELDKLSSDWNDYCQLNGLYKTRQAFEDAWGRYIP